MTSWPRRILGALGWWKWWVTSQPVASGYLKCYPSRTMAEAIWVKGFCVPRWLRVRP